jgi:hypothetical protein
LGTQHLAAAGSDSIKSAVSPETGENSASLRPSKSGEPAA